MAVNDRVADMLTRIRNGQHAYLSSVRCQHTKLLEAMCAALLREGYIRAYDVEEVNTVKKELVIQLKYFEGQPAIKQLKRVSKCGRRTYSPIKSLPKVANGLGVQILSTSKGVLSDYEARQQNVGGEVLCSVF